MKTIFLSLTLCLTFLSFAQSLPNGFKEAIQSDYVVDFKKLLNETNKNQCFEAGNSRYTLLALTIRFNSKNCFNYLLSQKVDLDKTCSSKTPLMYAAKYGYLKIAKSLIIAGANPKQENYKGQTALDYSKKYEQEKLYMFLKSL